VGAISDVLRPILRRTWRRLISMRTALVLLFLLALASVPGSLLPQRPLNPSKVDAYLKTHGAWGTFLDRIGAFDVFGSVWFAAIYLLLFASLIGCLIPRISVYARALRTKPLKAPRHLSRLAENASFDVAIDAERVAELASCELKPRWRTAIRTEKDGPRGQAVTVSAEKGYSREAGNLLFHISLLFALILIAAGRLLSYQGSVVVTEGPGFCNVLPSYDSFHAGRGVNQGNLAQFCIDSLNSFAASYRADGTPSQFKADVTYSEGLNGPGRHDVITVNHPLRLKGDRVYLINHGFSPTVTIKRPGQAAFTDTQAFLPRDTFYTSEGVFKEQGSGQGNDLGLQGLFAPTPVDQGGGVITSASPQVNNPVLALLAFTGDTGLGQGLPQSVYSLDTSKMKQVAAKNLSVGQTMTLPDGTTVTFSGYKQWASLQVSHDPTQYFLLAAAICMVLGLLGSLVVRRRRLWLRISTGPSDSDSSDGKSTASPDSVRDGGSRTLIEVGGLARNDSGNFAGEFAAMLDRLRRSCAADEAALARPALGSPTPLDDADTVGAGYIERD
jgi:cytochrome c biogenesis protein